MVTRRCVTGAVALFAAVGLGAMAVAGAIHGPDTSSVGAPGAGQERPAFNMRDDGVAIGGFDPVAYFVEGEARRGSPAYRYEKDGVTFLFENQENLDRFTADPERYIPEFGGFSVFGMARGKAYDTDPTVFDLIDGRLYLSRNEKVRELWQVNPAGYIERAEQAWEGPASR